jgi:hypothetical protein
MDGFHVHQTKIPDIILHDLAGSFFRFHPQADFGCPFRAFRPVRMAA